MKLERHIALALLLVSTARVLSQNSFQNLDFESAMPSLGQGFVTITNGLPGWTAYYQGNPINGVWYNTHPIDDAGTALFDGNSPSLQPIQGNYSVFLKGSSVFTPVSSAAAIAQTGQIPATALSLQFLSSSLFAFQVTFAGQPLSLVQLGSPYLIGADISPYAGQTGELRFTVPALIFGGMLDAIQFSNQAVPEPGVLALTVVGGLLLGWRRWRNISQP